MGCYSKAALMSGELVLTDILRYFVPVLSSTELKRGPVPIRVANVEYVLFRDNAGRVGALRDRCPHRWTPLSIGKVTPAGRLQCGYHGWHFGTDGNGCSPSQPNLTGCDVASLQAVERHDYIWVANPGVSPDSIGEMNWEGFCPANRRCFVFPAPVHVTLANIGDTEHGPYVHGKNLIDELTLLKLELQMERSEDEVAVTTRNPILHKFLAPLLGARNCDSVQTEIIYRYDPLRVMFTIGWLNSLTGKFAPAMSRAVFYIVPESDTVTRVHSFTFVSGGKSYLWRLLAQAYDAAFYRRLFKEDIKIVKATAHMPLDTKGMRLGKHDRGLSAVLSLLKKHYATPPET